MTSLGQVRVGIAAALENLDLVPYNFSPASPPVSNAAYIKPEPFDYDDTFETTELRFTIRCIVPSTNEESAQDLLDAWISPSGSSSVKQVLEKDPTLGGLVQSVRVQSLSNYGPLQFTDGRYCQASEQVVSVYL